MNDTQTQTLRKILSAINIYSPTGFSFAGQRVDAQMGLGLIPGQMPASPAAGQMYLPAGPAAALPVPGQAAALPVPGPAAALPVPGPAAFLPVPGQPAGQSPAQSPNPMIYQLAQALYGQAYVQRFGAAPPTPPDYGDPAGDMTEMLSQANSSHERWDRGWQVVQVAPSGQVLVHKHGATRTFWPGEFITQDGPGVPPRPGATVTVYSPHESRTTQPGFYFAFGQTVGDPQDIYDNVRFYWSIDAGAAADLVHGTTRLLNRFQIPFRFKCCNHRTLFYRLDSAVLYVSKRHYRLTAEVLVDLYRELRPHLRSGPLLFTRSLAPGLAFAEDPGTGESFGQFCCRVVAEGIWNAYLSGAQSVQARLDAIQKQFESYNLDFSRAYLRAGAVDQYEFPSYD